MQEVVQTTGRLWPGVGTMLRFATTWQISIVYSIILSAIWIALFVLLIIPVARLRSLPGLLLHLCWPIATILLFAGQFVLIAKASDWANNYVDTVGTPNFVASVGLLVTLAVVGIWFFRVVYLVATQVFRGDDFHPLLAPFVSTGVSWTLAYLALSTGGPAGLPHSVRWLVALRPRAGHLH